MVKRIVFVTLAVFAIVGLCSGAARAAIPNNISFQGRLTDSAGKPLRGIEQIKFDIYDDATAVKKPLMTETMLNVKVDSNGVFNVLLGTDEKAAEQLNLMQFDKPYWVEITVNGVKLSPRQPLVSVPYAFTAKNLVGGMVVANSGTGDAIYGKSTKSGKAGVNGVNTDANGYGVFGSGGFIGVGGSSVKTGVYGSGTTGVIGFNGNYPQDYSGTYGLLGGSPLLPPLMALIMGTYKYGAYGQADENNKGYLGYYVKTDTTSQYGVYGESTSGEGVSGISATGVGVYGKGDKGGVVGVSGDLGIELVYIGEDPRLGNGVLGKVKKSNRAGVYGLNYGSGPGIKGESTSGYGADFRSINSLGCYIKSDKGHGLEVSGGLDGVRTFASAKDKSAIYAIHSGLAGSGGYGIYTTSNYTGLYASGGTYAANLNGNVYVGGNTQISTGNKRALYAMNNSSQENILAVNSGSGTAISGHSKGIGVRGEGGDNYVTTTSGKYYGGVFGGSGIYGIGVKGNGYFTGTVLSSQTLDIAEWIKVSDPSVSAGDVVIIDKQNVKMVKKSDAAESTMVAGIISENPAFLAGNHLEKGSNVDQLTEKEMEAKGYRMLALAGQVDCKVVDENGAIEIGDLLTTSSTPGHAMKATDPKIGTIIGKALEPLASGKGKILVLISSR